MIGMDFGRRDIVLQHRDNTLQRVSETHRAYDSLHYRVMFWHANSWYNPHRCRQLINQLKVDMYANIESERLLFIHLN